MLARNPELRLHDGSVVAVIGAGPAGTFFAQFALRIARKQGIGVRVLLIDGKDFDRRGPPGCNMCAGVLTEGLVRKIEDEGFNVPHSRIQGVVDGFVLHRPSSTFALTPPEGSRLAGYTFFRGRGPRYGDPGPAISLDDYLLLEALKRGAEVRKALVKEIVSPPERGGLVELVCETGQGTQIITADLVVGAFGLNTNMLRVVEELGFGYRAPRTRRAFQVELFLGDDAVRTTLGNKVHVWSGLPASLRYAAMTPKGEYITVSLIGRGDVTLEDVREFMDLPRVKETLPRGWRFPEKFCNCAPRIGDTSARKPYADRMVIIGDACASRYYKNGIESALVTAKIAAQSALYYGVSDLSFKRHYMEPVERTIIRDNTYGNLLFRMHDLIARSDFVWRVMSNLARPTGSPQRAQLLREPLWEIITGSRPYRDIFFRLLSPRFLPRIALALPSALLRTVRQQQPQKRPTISGE